MSLSPPPAEVDLEPRRGGRARKQVEKFDASSGPATKKIRRRDEHNDEDFDLTEEGDSDVEQPAASNKKRQTNAPRTKKTKTNTTPGGSRKKRNAAPAVGQGDGGEGIKTDSSLFNALLSPDIALQSIVDEWVDTYQQSSGDEVSEQASAYELVLFFVRSCGLNSEIEQAEAMDEDGITDVVERIQDESVRVALASYPLISRTKELRPFKNNLNLFLDHLITSLSLTPLLFQTSENTSHSTAIVPLLLNWLNCMSTSPLRPIRHTATYMTLKINSTLCDVATSVSKDLSLKQRQKEVEMKKGGTTNAAQKRVKDAEKKVKEVQERKEQSEVMMTEVFNVMFVHRVRDADPLIRTDCLRELGVWAKKYPEFYANTSYLSYFTRGCNDTNNHARLETAKALNNLYCRESFLNNARTVTMRLAPRLVEMALRDIDSYVRVTAISVITAIDKTGFFADEDETQREKIARLVFDHEQRIRKAVGPFIVNLWEEKKEALKTEWSGARASKKKRAAKITEDDMASNLGWKALARLLVQTSQSLDQPSDPGTSSHAPILSPASSDSVTRATAAVESICAEYDLWEDWEGLVDYLLLDHSTSNDDMWLLEEEEESFMLQVFIAIIKRNEANEDDDDRSKTLIKILPRLFAKHQADVSRMTGILSIPGHMNLGLYLDMRLASAYESLWDDITKQFLQHADPAVLTVAIQAINHLTINASLAAANTTKITELQESLFASLRDAIGSEDIAYLSLQEEGIAKLEAIMLRLLLLQRSRDLVEAMEDVEGGESSGWDIICAFAERARLGHKEEVKMVEYAIHITSLHMAWLFKRFSADDSNDEDAVASLQAKRDKAVEIFQSLTLEGSGNVSELVRRQAFIAFISLHILFFPRKGNDSPAAKACPLKLEDEIQNKLGGAFQGIVEKYASEREVDMGDGGEEGISTKDDDEKHLPFLQFTAVFVSAIRIGVLEVDHAKEPLAHFGRFTASYDGVVKKLVDVLRDEGIYNRQAETVQHVARAALEQSFELFLDTDSEEPTATLALAKLISSAFIVHGTHFSVLRQIDPKEVAALHVESIKFVAQRVGNFVRQEKAATTKNKEQKARLQKKRFLALTYFRVLLLLLGPVTGTDALRIKNHLDDAVESLGVEVTVNKGWEPYRAYEKRLVAIASKDAAVKMAANKRLAARQEGGDTEMEDDEREETPTRAAGGRPRSNTLTRPNGNRTGNENGDRESSPLSPPASEIGDVIAVATSTPRKRPRADENDLVEGQIQVTADQSLDLGLELSSPPPAGNEDDEDMRSQSGGGDGEEQEQGQEQEQENDQELGLDDIVPSQRERSETPEVPAKRRKIVKRF